MPLFTNLDGNKDTLQDCRTFTEVSAGWASFFCSHTSTSPTRNIERRHLRTFEQTRDHHNSRPVQQASRFQGPDCRRCLTILQLPRRSLCDEFLACGMIQSRPRPTFHKSSAILTLLHLAKAWLRRSCHARSFFYLESL